jgi:hypothetical protein
MTMQTSAREMKMRSRTLVHTLLAVLLLTTACGRFSRAAGDPDVEPVPVMLVVENRHWNQITVHATSGTMRRRIGEVTPATTAEFELPLAFSLRGDLRLSVSPLASRETFRTDLIPASGGTTVHLTVETTLRLSSWTFR